jgi:hypothetical protein
MKWKYQVRIFETEALVSLEQALLAAGDQDWELVTIIPFPGRPPPLPPTALAIFKRPSV